MSNSLCQPLSDVGQVGLLLTDFLVYDQWVAPFQCKFHEGGAMLLLTHSSTLHLARFLTHGMHLRNICWRNDQIGKLQRETKGKWVSYLLEWLSSVHNSKAILEWARCLISVMKCNLQREDKQPQLWLLREPWASLSCGRWEPPCQGILCVKVNYTESVMFAMTKKSWVNRSQEAGADTGKYRHRESLHRILVVKVQCVVFLTMAVWFSLQLYWFRVGEDGASLRIRWFL